MSKQSPTGIREKKKKKKKPKHQAYFKNAFKLKNVIAAECVFTDYRPSLMTAESSVSVNNELRIAAQGTDESTV